MRAQGTQEELKGAGGKESLIGTTGSEDLVISHGKIESVFLSMYRNLVRPLFHNTVPHSVPSMSHDCLLVVFLCLEQCLACYRV